MADKTTDHGAPGIAAYDSETWGNVKELRLQDSPATATRRVTITAGSGGAELPLYGVVNTTGLAPYSSTVGSKTAVGILTAPVSLAANQSISIDVIVAGYFDYEALTFDNTFDTDEKKRTAFDGMGAPINIILDKNPYDSDGVLA